MSVGEFEVSVPSHQTRTITQRKKSTEARLSALGFAPVPQEALDKTVRKRQSVAFQVRALARLIDELLKGDIRGIEVAPTLFPDLRLPGDNPDDVLRYLLRSLRNELRDLDGDLQAMEADPAAVREGLGPLQPLALAVAQVFIMAPQSGAGDAILSMIGSLLDESGLLPWSEFLNRCTGPHTHAFAGLDLTSTSAAGTAKRKARRPERRPVAEARAETPPPQPAPKPEAAPRAKPAAPSANDGDDPLEIPLILVRPTQGDWSRVLFKRGLDYLTRVYNEPPEKLRPLLGDWVAQSGDDHQKVFRLLAKAQTQNVRDPKDWVSKNLTEGHGAHSPA